MSGLRGSQTPVAGKSRAAFDYPLSAAQMQQQQQQLATPNAAQPALSSPIHIQPRSSPRAAGSSSVSAHVTHMAQSCPTFSWQPPPAPSARPRLASVDPPPMELPPSPPVFSPMQQEQLKAKKEEPTSVALKKQIYSRSLSNYSSSAPTHVDYLSKFHPNFGPLDEAAGADDADDDSDDDDQSAAYRPSARAMPAQPHNVPDLDDEAPLEAAAAAGARGIGIGIGAAKRGPSASDRIRSVQQGDDFSLSKSPTIFSILSTSAQQGGLHTATTSVSSSGSGSPGQAILGSIAAGVEPHAHKRRSLVSHKPPMQDAKPPQQQQDNEDDLQFSISLTDEAEAEADDAGQQDQLPLY